MSLISWRDIAPREFTRGSLVRQSPDLAPLSLVRTACRVDSEDDDELLRTYMRSAMDWIETETSRPLADYLWTVTWRVPANLGLASRFLIPPGPVYDVRTSGSTHLAWETRNGIDAWITHDTVREAANVAGESLVVEGILELVVETSWSEHRSKLLHPFLTLVAEMYRTRELRGHMTSVTRVVSQALGAVTRRVTLE